MGARTPAAPGWDAGCRFPSRAEKASPMGDLGIATPEPPKLAAYRRYGGGTKLFSGIPMWFVSKMNEEPPEQTFSIVAYLAAVAVGCLFVGGLIPWGDGVMAAVAIMAPAALLVGFLPGLLMCLPGALLSFHVSKRFRLLGAVWYVVFGALTGMSVGILFVLASRPDVTTVAFTGLITATAGAAAALTYRWVEKRESVYRTKYYRANQRKLGN